MRGRVLVAFGEVRLSANGGQSDEADRSLSGGSEKGSSTAGIFAAGDREEGRPEDIGAGAGEETHEQPKARKPLYLDGSWGRDVKSEDIPSRKPAWKDYGRIIHSSSFRRLQGKTQVFPVHESDFFRNRLTHSLEVAQISEGIAQRINEMPEFEEHQINERACLNAALIHDLGHPPFGHNGERALDDAMKSYGGFEGNAQTIRIITRLEKKSFKKDPVEGDTAELCDNDRRAGLGLTYRTILSALKYDSIIPPNRGGQEKLVKGFYATERAVIERAKDAVDPDWRSRGKFKTIECAIMDIADDIAYSTYDLEDCLKAGFLSPAEILSTDMDLFQKVAQEANRHLAEEEHIDGQDALGIFYEIFQSVFSTIDEQTPMSLSAFIDLYRKSVDTSEDGYVRTALSSKLVKDAIDGVRVEYNSDAPWLSRVYLVPERLKIVEVLKHFTFLKTVYSARVKVGEYRGYEVIRKIFDALSDSKGNLLMPEDLKATYKKNEHNASARSRAICDFIAGMTDRYALEFYARLHSDDPQSIFKPI